MGVYLPNYEKPKSCAECELWSLCFYPKAPKEIDNKVMPDCEIEELDLVRCGECKHWHEGEWYNTCDKHIGHGFPSDYFCSDGERRNDE